MGTTDDGLYMICECTHLTDFSTQVDEALSQVSQDFKMVLSRKVTIEDLKNIVLLVVMGGFFLLYVIAFFYVSRWDHHDRLKHLRQKRLSMHETKHVKLAVSPFFQEPEYVNAVGFRAKLRVIASKFVAGLKQNHKLLSIAFKYDEHFTRTQRLTVIFTVVMSQMFTNALLYRLRQGEKALGSSIVAGLISFLCMIPVTIAFVLMFKMAGRKQTYLVRYRVDGLEGNIAEVETDAYGQPKQYTPIKLAAMDLEAMANCVDPRALRAVAASTKRQGLSSRSAQICRGVFLANYNRDVGQEPPETEGDGIGGSDDPLKSVLVQIKSHLQQQQTEETHLATPPRKSIFKRGSASSGVVITPPVVALAPEAKKTKVLSEVEKRTLAVNQLQLMLGQGGGDTMLANMLKFDPLLVAMESAAKIKTICTSIPEEGDEGEEDGDDTVATALQTLEDWLAKCHECYEAQQANAQAIAARAAAELQRTETQLKKLQQTISAQFEQRVSEMVTFAESVGDQNATMVEHTTSTVKSRSRRLRSYAANDSTTTSAATQPGVAIDRRVSLTIKQQKQAILSANKQQLRERRKTVKKAHKALKIEQKKLRKQAQQEIDKLLVGLRGVAKMKRKLKLYMETREQKRVAMLPLHERQLYLVEKQRLSQIKGTSRLLYNQFLKRQPAKLAKPIFPEWVVYISYGICFAWCIWCAFFVLMFAFEIDSAEAQLWIGSLASGLAMTYVVSDPLKIFMRMGVMPLIATSILADAGLFRAVDASALAIGAIAAVGTAGVAQLVAKQGENARRLTSQCSKKLMPGVPENDDDEKQIRAQAMAIAGRLSEASEEEEEDDDNNGVQQLAAGRSKCGSFTNIAAMGGADEDYAAQRAAFARELEEDEANEKAAKTVVPTTTMAMPKLTVTKGPPVQLLRPRSDSLSQQSSQVLKSKPTSVFGPDQSLRKPPVTLVTPVTPVTPCGPAASPFTHMGPRNPPPITTQKEQEQDETVEKCECGESIRGGPAAMANHKTNQCSHRLVQCRAGCGMFIQARSRNGHELSPCRLVMCRVARWCSRSRLSCISSTSAATRWSRVSSAAA